MTWHYAYIGDYTLSYDDTSANNIIQVSPSTNTKTHYGEIPSTEECNSALGTSGRLLAVKFSYCQSMLATPIFREEVYYFDSALYNCSALLVAPKLPKTIGASHEGDYTDGFIYCSSLITASQIPQSAKKIGYLFYRCESLKTAASIPPNVETMSAIYRKCTSLEGEFCIRPQTLTYAYALTDTTKPITIYGDQTLCEAVAATANNGNASWQPWYDPVPAVTDRGQGSYTTADDMTRMVRNGVLAVDTYAPGRMVYHQGDIVREDEWEALVEAAQTIDPTVTMSTHYTNLNKIEKAFDDAL